jgi:PilZ domain
MATRAPARRVQPTKNEPIVIQLISDGFEARDISATGAGIFVPPHLEGCNLKSPVNLVVRLPETEPFRARGRIVHRTKLGREFLGVEFMNLSRAQVEEITRYVERRLSQAQGKSSRRMELLATREDAVVAPRPARTT